MSLLLVLGLACGAFLQKYGFFDLQGNAFYQEYVGPVVHFLADMFTN